MPMLDNKDAGALSGVPARVEAVHVWIGTYADGAEFVVTLERVPLVSADPSAAWLMRPLAKEAMRLTNYHRRQIVGVRLVTYAVPVQASSWIGA